MPRLDDLLAEGCPPLIAILRGIAPHEAGRLCEILIDAGIRIIEVPANSPGWLESIREMVAVAEGRALIGGGTILDAAQASSLSEAGGRLLVAPNCNPAVIARGLELGMDVMPGIFTPTEALAAIAAGARHLKLFPASSLPVGHLQAMAQVLSRECGIWAVGGVDQSNMAQWLAGGARGVAVGGSLFAPGLALEAIEERAVQLVGAVSDARL